MTVSIQDFILEIMELLVNVIKIIPKVYKIVPHIKEGAVVDLTKSIEPLIEWVLSILPSGLDPFLSLSENETVATSFKGVLNATSEVESSALTHIVQGTAYLLNNESSYNYIGSQFFYVLFDFLMQAVDKLESIVIDLSIKLPWIT
ncbi:MAG: hypothetical protein SVM80_04835 [Halobacteriota archaeon]|nr:hypothetical protein [Halobacteriota archaeon]